MSGGGSQGRGEEGSRVGTVVLLVRGKAVTCLCSAFDLWCDRKAGVRAESSDLS